ncbi:MAG: hypothetical protein ACRBCJ_02920 [Hyphomicrobiaceae bacterium]
MPPVLAIAAAAVGIYAGYKWLKRDSKRAQDRAAHTTRTRGDGHPVDRGTLEFDEIKGVYRPNRSKGL